LGGPHSACGCSSQEARRGPASIPSDEPQGMASGSSASPPRARTAGSTSTATIEGRDRDLIEPPPGRGEPRHATSRSPLAASRSRSPPRSEEHTSELQSRFDLVCRLLLEKKH